MADRSVGDGLLLVMGPSIDEMGGIFRCQGFHSTAPMVWSDSDLGVLEMFSSQAGPASDRACYRQRHCEGWSRFLVRACDSKNLDVLADGRDFYDCDCKRTQSSWRRVYGSTLVGTSRRY